MSGGDPPGTASGAPVLRIAAATDPGRSRTENQDAFLVAKVGGTRGPGGEGPSLSTLEPDADGQGTVSTVLNARPPGVLMVVADGMGGAAAGDVASNLAIAAVEETLRSSLAGETGAPPRPEDLAKGIRAADGRIRSWASRHDEYRGMGSTMTALLAAGAELHLAHVGDSRAYLIRDGSARRLTRDHTVAQELVEAGTMSQEEADRSDQRHVLLHALGGDREPEVLEASDRCRPGDILLLCSDGLTDGIDDGELVERISVGSEPREICRRLLALANERGGPDNITVVAARVVEAPDPADENRLDGRAGD
jgi:protein phosphatase